MSTGRAGAGKSSLVKYVCREMGAQFKVKNGEETLEPISYPPIIWKVSGSVRTVEIIDFPGHSLQEADWDKVEKFILCRAKNKTPVVLCLYLFIKPRISVQEAQFVCNLSQCVPVVPLVAQSDTMTLNELCAFKKKIDFLTRKAEYFSSASLILDRLPAMEGFQKPCSHIFTILGRPKREYHWGYGQYITVSAEHRYFDNWRLLRFLGAPDLVKQAKEKAKGLHESWGGRQ